MDLSTSTIRLVLRGEIKDPTPPTEKLRSMQARITAESEAFVSRSEGWRRTEIYSVAAQK